MSYETMKKQDAKMHAMLDPNHAQVPDYDLKKLTRLIGNGVDEGPGFHTLMAMSANCHAGATRLLDVWTRIALEACEVEA